MRFRHLLPNFRIAIVGAGAIGLYYGGSWPTSDATYISFWTDYDAVRKRGL